MSRSNRNRNKNKNKNKNLNKNQNQNKNRDNKDIKKDILKNESFSDNGDKGVLGDDLVKLDNKDLENKENLNNKKDTKPVSVEINRETPQKIKVFFLNDVNEYIESFETILSLSRQYSRLNVVIKTSEEPKTQKLPSNIHIYTGEVWYNIHRSRESEGFYAVK